MCYIYNIAKRNAYLNAFKSVQIKVKNVSLDILEAYLLQYCEIADQNALIFILDRDILKKYQNEFTLALGTYHTKIKKYSIFGIYILFCEYIAFREKL